MDPVLSDEEWTMLHNSADTAFDVFIGRDVVAYFVDGQVHLSGAAVKKITEPAKLIAILNDALRDDDPHKITRESIDTLRSALDRLAQFDKADDTVHLRGMLREWADALDTYLPT